MSAEVLHLLAITALSLFDSFAGLAEDAAAYGYPAIALLVAGDGVFPLLPGETAVIAGAVLAGTGELSLTLVIVAGTLGAMAGDWAAFFIGRAGEGPIRRALTRMAGAERLAAAEAMVDREGPLLVFVGRFLPGLRIGVNMACGAGRMRFRRFVLFNFLGALAWASVAALLGFFLGRAFADQPWVAFVIAFSVTILAGVVIAARERGRIRRERDAAAVAAASDTPIAAEPEPEADPARPG